MSWAPNKQIKCAIIVTTLSNIITVNNNWYSNRNNLAYKLHFENTFLKFDDEKNKVKNKKLAAAAAPIHNIT
jgi:hypothetical protein